MSRRRDVPQSPDGSPTRLLGRNPQLSTDVTTDSTVTQDVQPEPIANIDPPVRPRWNIYVVKCAIVASVSCIMIGFDTVVLSEATLPINKDKRMTSGQVALQAGYLHVWSLFVALAIGWLSDWIGRRGPIMGTGLFFVVGTLLMGLFPNNALLLLGQAITQVGVALAPMIATNYIAELSPASSRGLLTTVPQLSLNFGTYFGHGFNYIASRLDPNFGAFVILSLGIISLVVFVIGVCIVPESPLWLIIQGREDDAKCVLAMTSGSEEEATRSVVDIVEANRQSTREGVCGDLLHPTRPLWHMLISASGIQCIQQACGIETLILYSPCLFEKAGVASNHQKLIWTITIHLVKALPILIPTFSLDKVGRKRLLLVSIGGMIVSLFILGTCLIEIDQNDKPEWAVATSMPSLLLCVGFYSMGVGPVASVYTAEVFPLHLRAQGYAVAVATNQFVSALLAVAFSHLYEAVSLGGAVLIFMVLAILAWLFVRVIMPETNGQNLEEIWRDFGTFIVWRRSEATREIELQRNSARGQQ